ncbi:hypothetical protein RhiirA4_486359 [Rhizophagus irregularis]|uniref:Uncharacterized protein n=1 Tax=Rhizophagus irregularis TaxID=588596 RepID=A0A2I1HRC5_9GLOM|nr:hypothetical protein RhiirA4_486359 [Rhizophagus irregularis]
MSGVLARWNSSNTVPNLTLNTPNSLLKMQKYYNFFWIGTSAPLSFQLADFVNRGSLASLVFWLLKYQIISTLIYGLAIQQQALYYSILIISNAISGRQLKHPLSFGKFMIEVYLPEKL